MRGCDADDPQYNETFMEFTIPKEDDDEDVYQKCKMNSPINDTLWNTARSPLLRQMKSFESSDQCLEENFNEKSTIECPDGYVYDRSLFETSATMEVSLCDSN